MLVNLLCTHYLQVQVQVNLNQALCMSDTNKTLKQKCISLDMKFILEH